MPIDPTCTKDPGPGRGPELPMNGWSIEAVLAHIHALFGERDRRYMDHFAAQRAAVEAALASAEKAIAKSEASIDKRLDLLNEFRDGVATAKQVESLEKVVDGLSLTVNSNSARSAGVGMTMRVMAAGLAAVGSIVAIATTIIIATR